MRGEACFTPEPDVLLYEEAGELVFGAFRSEARREYRFCIEGDAVFSVLFTDGGFFHRAQVADGLACVHHDCAPDDYRGRYRITGPDGWMLSWRIQGPRKDLVIGTRFSR
jgi:hypothetical protein